MPLKISIAAACVVAVLAAFGLGILLNQGTAQDTPATLPQTATAPVGPAGPTPQPLVLLIDRARVLQLSSAGQDIATQVQTFKATLQEEFGPEKEKIETEAKALRDQAAVLDAKVREQRQAALVKKGEALQKRFTDRQGEIQQGVTAAQKEVIAAVDPILKEIMVERGANILIERQAIVWTGIDIDVTNAVIQRLDERLPKVKVEPLKAQPPAEGTGNPATPGQ
jgi:Skp family chaperone for outer membrane proteins